MKLSVIILLTALPLISCTPQANSRSIENSLNTQAVKKGTVMKQVRDRCRSVLYKVESRDDLIKQMYETAFKDDCLYAMYAEELENIWRIPVVEDYDNNYLHRNLPSSVGLYVAVRHIAYKTSFVILSAEQYLKEKISISPENRFPDFLSRPKEKEIPPEYGGYYPCQKNDPIKELVDYYWRENGREMIAANNGSGAIQAFTFYSDTEMSPMGY